MGRAEPGRVIAARYRLRAVIRGDDMGAVWLADDGLRYRSVVLRPIPWPPLPDAKEQESRRERLASEALALAQLGHPNIVGVLDVAEDDDDGGRPWMVVEAAPYRFPHCPLSDAVRNDGPLRPEQAARVGLQVLAAIRAAHAAGVLHRDIKPGSILLGPGNSVLLADFGMVTADGVPALTTLEALTGSPLYMAPERASGEPATPAADLWSLGAALYAAVEGRAPFHRDSKAAVLTAVMNACPDPPRRAGPLWPVLSGLLRKDPGARPDADAVEWLFRRVGDGPGPPPVPLARDVPPAAGAVPPAAGAVRSPVEHRRQGAVAAPPVPPGVAPGSGSSGAHPVGAGAVLGLGEPGPITLKARPWHAGTGLQDHGQPHVPAGNA